MKKCYWWLYSSLVYAPPCFTLSETRGVKTLVILMGSLISIPPTNEVAGMSWMLQSACVCLSTLEPHVIITHDPLDLSPVQGGLCIGPPSLYNPLYTGPFSLYSHPLPIVCFVSRIRYSNNNLFTKTTGFSFPLLSVILYYILCPYHENEDD